MLSEEEIETIRKDFEFLTDNPNILGILAYRLLDTDTIRICIVYPNCNDIEAQELLQEVYCKVDATKYDVYIFEKSDFKTLHEVLEESVVVWCKDEIQLESYLESYKRFIEERKSLF